MSTKWETIQSKIAFSVQVTDPLIHHGVIMLIVCL